MLTQRLRTMFRGNRRTSLTSERGSTLIEFAIGSIVLFLLLFGIMEFGRAIWLFGTVSHGAREGARYAMVRGTASGRSAEASDAAIQTYVQNFAPGLGGATVSSSWSPNSCGEPVETPCKQPGVGKVKVHVQVMFDPVVWFMPSIPLRTTSEMTIAF